jgi:hypothetical protein
MKYAGILPLSAFALLAALPGAPDAQPTQPVSNCSFCSGSPSATGSVEASTGG